MIRCCIWNGLVFVLSVYKLQFKSYGYFSADLQKRNYRLRNLTYIHKWPHNNHRVPYI